MRGKWLSAGIILAGISVHPFAGNLRADSQDPKKDKSAQDKTSPAEKEAALVAQLQPALKNKKWVDAETLLVQLIALQPKNWEYEKAYADTEFNLEKLTEALDAYDKAIVLAQRITYDPSKPDSARAKAAQSEMFSAKGVIFLRQKKNDEAISSYALAAELSPEPASGYLNLCIVQYDVGTLDAALAACEKAQKADPAKADVYFMKGAALYAMGMYDDNNKFVVPAGTEEALKKYLELAPKGAHADDAKQMLAKIAGSS